MAKRILGDTTIRSLIEADTDQAVGIHSRMMELTYNILVASHNQTVLYNALVQHAGLNVLKTMRQIFLELPHAVQVEVRCPFLYSFYRKWKSERNDAGELSDIEIRYDDEVISEELADARMDFDKNCMPVMSSITHRYNFYMPHARVYSRVFYSPSEDVEYLVASAEFMCLFVCSWWGVVRDAHIGQISPGDDKLGQYSPPTSDFVTAYSDDEKVDDDSNENKNAALNDDEESLDELDSNSDSDDA